MDKYFSESSKTLNLDNLHIIGITCLFIASKVNDVIPLRLGNISKKIVMGKYSEENIMRCEVEILKTLDFNINLVCAFDFLSAFYKEKKIILSFVYTCELICYYCQMFYYISKYNEDEIAAGCVYFAGKAFGYDELIEQIEEQFDRERIEVVSNEIIANFYKITGNGNKTRLNYILKADAIPRQNNKMIFNFHDKRIQKEQESIVRHN